VFTPETNQLIAKTNVMIAICVTGFNGDLILICVTGFTGDLILICVTGFYRGFDFDSFYQSHSKDIKLIHTHHLHFTHFYNQRFIFKEIPGSESISTFSVMQC
jgi:hypothetical protein